MEVWVVCRICKMPYKIGGEYYEHPIDLASSPHLTLPEKNIIEQNIITCASQPFVFVEDIDKICPACKNDMKHIEGIAKCQ